MIKHKLTHTHTQARIYMHKHTYTYIYIQSGQLLMDQAFFAGVGNIYRAEILFASRIHPNVKGAELSRSDFDIVWDNSVQLMKTGKEIKGKVSNKLKKC